MDCELGHLSAVGFWITTLSQPAIKPGRQSPAVLAEKP
jgi:hypothetical protein